ncbi:UDP-N-acetylmuramoyl-L-alanine--D-glutamate ligase [Variovorax terrae]|nr:UDP-N-acetylmuramoyl-L-alanine--D-glutamate ligase [Variovorax terrae]
MARWCARFGARVTVADTREHPPQLESLCREAPQAVFAAGPFAAALVEGTDVRAVFTSPGLPPAAVAPVVDAAAAMGLWTGNELSLFAQALRELRTDLGYAPQVLAITGTNGKTTVTSLTGQLVERAGKSVAVAGNIGPTLLDTLAAKLDEQQAHAAAQAEIQEDPEDIQDAPTEPPAAGPAEASTPVADEPGVEDVHPRDLSDAEEAPEAKFEAQDEPPEPDEEPPVVLPPPEEPKVSLVLPQVWVLELSSFQLDGARGFEPSAAVVLNISQDHLDWHGSLQAYAAAKARVFGQQGLMILNREDPMVMAMLPEPVRVRLQRPLVRTHVTFGGDMPQRPGDFGLELINGMAWLVRALEADETRKKRKGDEEELHIQRLMPADALRIRGRHNAVNALAALALASAAGCSLAPMLYGLREYRGEPHRVEPVAIVDGIEYFDDSKGTNVGATVAALQGLGAERRVVVILGGDGKGQDFSPLAAPVARHARAAVLIGRDGPQIRAALESTGVPLLDAASMEQAVALATQQAGAGDAVLMSPACASFDMFDNYEHRARVFREAVDELAQGGGALALSGGPEEAV